MTNKPRKVGIWCHGAMLAAALALSACTATEPRLRHTDANGEHAASAAERSFQANGFLEQDIMTVAAYIAADIPESPRLRAQSGPVRIVVNHQDVRVQDGQVVLDRGVFAQQLLMHLDRHSNQRVSYIDRFQSLSGGGRSASSAGTSGRGGESGGRGGSGGGGRSGSGGGGRGASGGGASGSAQSGATHRMEVEVSRLPVTESGSGAQRYHVRVVEASGGVPVWQGSYDLDAPLPTGR